jgi:hypothetical protein
MKEIIRYSDRGQRVTEKQRRRKRKMEKIKEGEREKWERKGEREN